MATDYRKQATQEYDASYNKKVQALKNQLAQNQQTLDQQKGVINANYDLSVANQNLANKKAKNSLSNTMLGRGLSNSSIAVSGLAEADQINNRMIGNINRERTGALNDIEQQKALLAQNLEGTLATMSADREDAISALARQLEDRQWEKDFKNKGFEFQKDTELANRAFRDKSFNFQQETERANQAFRDKSFNFQQEIERANQAYRNSSLAMQREQMLAEQAYKNASLAQQRELANAQLAWEREKYSTQNKSNSNDAYNMYLQTYADIKGNPNYTRAQRDNALKALYEETELYEEINGTDLSKIRNAIDTTITPRNRLSGPTMY